MAVPGFYNAADQDLYDQGDYFLPQEQYRLNLGTDTGAPNRVEFNPSQEGIGSLQQYYPFPNYGEEEDDDDGRGKGLPPGPNAGLGNLLDRYDQAGYFGRNLINMPMSMLAPPLAAPLAMYNMGRSVYDFGRKVLGYNNDIDIPEGGSFSRNPGLGFSNRDTADVQQFGQDVIDRQDYETFGTAKGETAAESEAADAAASESYSDSEMD